MRTIMILVSALILAACAQAPEPVEASSGTAGVGAHVTYRYDGEDVGEASAQAAAYCGKFRKRAWLRTTARQNGDNRATFDCR